MGTRAGAAKDRHWYPTATAPAARHLPDVLDRAGAPDSALRWVAPYSVSQDLLDDEAPQAAVVRRVKKRS